MRRMKSSHVFVLLLAATLLVPLGAVMAEEASLQGSENYLENSGFEGEYIAFDEVGDIKVAPGWEPWYVEGNQDQQEDGFGRVPSFYWSSEGTDPGGTKEGELAQFWKHTHGTGAGGVYQTVSVPNNSKLRLAVWARTFTCQPKEDNGDCIQDDGAWMGVQIAVDPNGGTDFYASSVVFTPAIAGTSNDWQELVLEADAPGSDQVTVFFMYNPDWPREQNKVWFDNASLLVIGEAEGEAASSDDGGTSAPAPQFAAFVVAQPPQADGSVVHTVVEGDTLLGIVVAYTNEGYSGVTLESIKDLNNLPNDIAVLGSKLTIVPPGGGAPAPAEETPEETEEEATEETEGEGEEEEEADETPEETEEVEEVAETTGQICMSLFDDANNNTLLDAGELLLSGGTLTVTGATSGFVENYTTDGATEPHCFSSLAPGEYVASATAPFGYEMTTVSSWSLQVESGANLELSFGAFGSPGEAPTEGEEETTDDGSDGGGFFSNAGRVIIGVSGLLVLAVAGGLAAYFLVFRRA